MRALRRVAGLWVVGGLTALLAGCPGPPSTAGGGTSPGGPAPQPPAPVMAWQCLAVGENGLLLLTGEGSGAPLTLGQGEGAGPGARDTFAAAVTADGSRAAFSNRAGGVTLLEAATGRFVTATPETQPEEGRPPEMVWSPQGDALAYVCRGDLYLVSLDGTTRRMTTTADVTQAGWSPDGKTLAYGRRDEMDKDLGLWTQAACGSKPVQLVPSTGDVFAASWPQWSPDGKWIVFVQAWEGGGLGFVSADGETRRLGVDDAWLPLFWLADSSAAVYDGTSPEGPVRGLCVCTPTGKPRVLLKGLVEGFDMLPEGRVVAARAPEEEEEGARELTVLLADAARPGTAPKELGKIRDGYAARVLWRPDGGAYAVVSELSSDDPKDDGKRHVHLGTPDGPLVPAGEGIEGVVGWVRAPLR